MMTELHLPWLELTTATPLCGAILGLRIRDDFKIRWFSVLVTGVTLLLSLGAWADFGFGGLHSFDAHDKGYQMMSWLHPDMVVIDELSAPLLPLAALLYLVTVLATPRTKSKRFPFAWALVSEGILLALLSCRAPWGVIALLTLQILPPLWELRSRDKPMRVYCLHMGLFVFLLVVGWYLIAASNDSNSPSILGVGMLMAAVLLRSGIVPVHCWLTDLFEHATFGTAMLFVTPMSGAYAAVRLLLPVAPDWALHGIAVLSLFTAVYASGMALVQIEARRFFCYLFLSHSSLVLVGLEVTTPIGLTGALCIWISVGVSLAGFGLTRT